MTSYFIVRLDRLSGYQSFDIDWICESFGVGPITPASLVGVTPYAPRNVKQRHLYHLERVKFFFEHPRKQDPILISNGLPDYRPPEEPLLYDGRHRFLATVLRGDATIRALFGFNELLRRDRLAQNIIDYLIGKTDVKPG